MFSERDYYWMNRALELAKKAESQGEVPVGAVLVLDDQSVGEGWNQPISTLDPTAHAETVALRSAAKAVGNYRLLNTTLYVTLEPCLMCAGALIQARIKRLVFGAFDPKAGAIASVCKGLDIPCNHRLEHTGGLLTEPCGELLTQFFKNKRAKSA
ncbi:MAG TPA: tRNA adenosine(34) deaminase TadA [Gammaproteobacteria bacterium]|nr:tRNA adenosine(34) deaminase TadA [Gammaproteobacteria bacterium]